MTKAAPNYRELQAELDGILNDLQASEIDIDKAMLLYEKGLKIVGQLDKQLKTAQNKIIKLKPTKVSLETDN